MFRNHNTIKRSRVPLDKNLHIFQNYWGIAEDERFELPRSPLTTPPRSPLSTPPETMAGTPPPLQARHRRKRAKTRDAIEYRTVHDLHSFRGAAAAGATRRYMPTTDHPSPNLPSYPSCVSQPPRRITDRHLPFTPIRDN